MAPERSFVLTHSEKRDFDEMRRLFNRRPKNTGQQSAELETPRDESRPPIIAALLDNLNSGSSAQAVVLELRSFNAIQVLTAYGGPTGGQFRLGFKLLPSSTVEWTPYFKPATDSAAVLQAYLSALPSVGIGNVEVTMGLVTLPDRTQHNTWRWIITFCGKFANKPVLNLEIDDQMTGAGLLLRTVNLLEATSRIETINEVLGVSDPTPLMAGARVMAQWIDGIGYCIHACEVRDFGDYGLFT